jgi:hypothetical protein
MMLSDIKIFMVELKSKDLLDYSTLITIELVEAVEELMYLKRESNETR